jgi:hypothetical protein
MELQCTPEQLRCGVRVAKGQTMHGRVGQGLAFAFRPLRRLQLGPAPAAGLRAVEDGAAKRTAIHPSRLKKEQ